MNTITTKLASALGCLLESVSDPKDDSQTARDLQSAREILAAYDEAMGEPLFGTRDDRLEAARDQYACDEVEVEESAMIADGEGGFWVQAWVWVANDEDDE